MPCAVDEPAPYSCKRGTTLIVPLEAFGAVDGALAGYEIDAGLKEAVGGLYMPPGSRPRVATFTPTPRPSGNGIGPGWNLTLGAAETLALEPGTYVTDGLVTLADGVTKIGTEPLFIRIEQGVSA